MMIKNIYIYIYKYVYKKKIHINGLAVFIIAC